MKGNLTGYIWWYIPPNIPSSDAIFVPNIPTSEAIFVPNIPSSDAIFLTKYGPRVQRIYGNIIVSSVLLNVL